MAIDSRDKRASAVGFGLLSLMSPPVPDGSFSRSDLQQILSGYSGFSTLVLEGITLEGESYVRSLSRDSSRVITLKTAESLID